MVSSRHNVPTRSREDQRTGSYIRLAEYVRDILNSNDRDRADAPMTAGQVMSHLGSAFRYTQRLWPRDQEGVQAHLRELEAEVHRYGLDLPTLPSLFYLRVEDFYTDICELFHTEFHREPHLGWLLQRPHIPPSEISLSDTDGLSDQETI